MSIQRVSPDSMEPITPRAGEDEESIERELVGISIPEKDMRQIVSRSHMEKEILLRES
jgi:hypothetical protein